MDLVITIIAHGTDDIGEREYLVPPGTSGLITDALADAGIVVDQFDVDMEYPEDAS